MDADVFISLAHFKGHEATGFGGTLKNIGMGCGSRAGKMEMHSAGKPHVEEELAATAAKRSALMMRLSLKTKKLPSTTTNA